MMNMANKQPRYVCLASILFLMLLTSTTNAAVGNEKEGGARIAALKLLPISTALDTLAQELKVHIFIMGRMQNENVVLNLVDRSPMDNLKSILRGHSYALVFNIPPYSYSAIIETPSGGYKLLSKVSGWSANRTEGLNAPVSSSTATHSAEPTAPAEKDDVVINRAGMHLVASMDSLIQSKSAVLAFEEGGRILSSGKKELVQERINQIRQNIENFDERAASSHMGEQLDLIQQQIDDAVDQAFEDDADETWNALLAQIDHLEQQISSGEADRFYNKWAQIRGKYAFDPYEELQRLQEKLDAF